MQELLADLLPWVAAFYVLDGLVEVRRGQFMLSSPWGVSFRLLRPGLNHLGLSPMAEAIAAIDLPWLTSRAALLVFDPKRRFDLPTIGGGDVSLIPWTEVAPNAIGKKVRSHGRTLATAPQPALAARLSVELQGLAKGRGAAAPPAGVAPPGPRTLAEIRRRQRWHRRGLKTLATLLFLWICGVGSLVASSRLVLPPSIMVLVLAALVGAEVVLALLYARAADASWKEATSQASWLLLWPIAALHPLLHLSFRLGSSGPALDAAASVLPAGVFHELAATEYGRATVSLRAATGALAEGLTDRLSSVVASARAVGLTERDLQRPPRRELGEAAWCPTCRGRFIAGASRCMDCDVPLSAFEQVSDRG